MSNKDGRTKVLFVCVGNACRSPMAEAIARVDAPDAIEAFSAGLAPIGSVAGMTKQTLMRNGYWVEGLEPKSISPEVWEQADIVINLSGRSGEQAFRECSKVEDWEIEDPFGQDIQVYQQVFERIRLRVAELSQKCRRETGLVGSAERRARARLCPTSPIFINLNGASGANVGIAFNISEGGFALAAAEALPGGSLHNIRIQFPGSREWIEASGQIAWRSESNREAGVRFVGLTEKTRLDIRNWISSQAFPRDLQEQMDGISEDLRLEVPDAAQTERAIPGSYERTSICSDEKSLLFGAKRARDQRNSGVPRRRWETFAVVGVMIGLISLTFEWVTMRPDVQKEVAATVPQNARARSGAVEGPTLPAPSGFANTPSPVDAMGMQAHSAKPLLAEEQKRIPDLSLEDVDRQARAMQRRSASAIIKTSSGTIKSVLAPAAAIVNRTLVARVQPLPVGRLPAPSPQPEVKIAPPALSTPNLPTDSPIVEFKELKSSMSSPPPPPRQPATPGRVTAAVAIVADPYPSLRIPDGGISKKQRQAASLQLGHLLSRVEPIYPEEAKQQGIQGTVRLHAIIGRQGSVENLESVDGSPVLAAAAVNAVRQWRYTETLVAGRSVETEEDIAITFRLSNPIPPTN
jgi:TonB family protein